MSEWFSIFYFPNESQDKIRILEELKHVSIESSIDWHDTKFQKCKKGHGTYIIFTQIVKFRYNFRTTGAFSVNV